MKRLQDIQKYLLGRCTGCKSQKTIFGEPSESCFAAEYLTRSTELSSLCQRIEKASDRSRDCKKTEWKRACEKYDNHSERISSGTCVCSYNSDGTRNVQGCTKCWHKRCRKRMTIAAHEDFLPDDHNYKAAVVFELKIPRYLKEYRDATWRLISLGHPSKPKAASPPVKLLKDFDPLTSYKDGPMTGISLASITKSFLQTHYGKLKMKVSESDVLLPLGLNFSYYDITSETWVKDLDKPLTFQHLCGIHVPSGLRASIMKPRIHPPPINDGPSSYGIVASQTKCPSDMSVHEFTSYQRLLSGKSRRWLTMLVELGASDLNFSTEDTMHVFSHLAAQAGPAQDGSNILRDAHLVFKDQSFCLRLTEQIESRLRNIASNWREVHSMEMLITLSLRIFALSSDPHPAEKLLKLAQDITLKWITRLRDEVRSAVEASAAEGAARYGFWAALLCRRTFATFVDSDFDMDADDLCSFVQASIALQENLVVDLEKLPQTLKNMLVRDVKMAYRIQPLIKQSIQSNPDSLGAAINRTWSDSGNSIGRTFSRWESIPSPYERWVVSSIRTMVNKYMVSQVLHYNFVEGHLLVDGKPLGRLPREIRESEEVKELFGNQHLLTFPSSLGGMTHVMATRICNHEIHFGLRGGRVVIRAVTRNGLLEYVPPQVFRDNDSIDLPLNLVDNCAHWLNLNSRCLEIRRKPVIWVTRPSDWIVDVLKGQAKRRNKVLLVDPHSDLCKRVAEIFRHFEDPKRLTVFQPLSTTGKLSVELRHLELSFFVNKNGLLQCRELDEEVDPDQDAGTLYGFESKIVLRSVANIERRSIITALGELTYKRRGMHVTVWASSSNEYGRFGIDNVLGRLSCPPEPRLLYSKSKFHAFTSFPLPDPLTGRTGTEEAMHTLRSGYCQPWTPLVDNPISILESIRKLSPIRDYYPKDKRLLQTVSWDPHLTMCIQHESYEVLVQGILAKSNSLKVFAPNNEETEKLDVWSPPHLRRRGETCRRLYERSTSDADRLVPRVDTVYQSRDRPTNSPQATRVYQIARLIRKQPFKTYMKRRLSAILQGWILIGGFNAPSGSVSGSLADLVDEGIEEQWGSLVNFCRRSRDPYRLMFRLSLLSLGAEADMDVLRSLAAFGCIEELKVLEPPSCPSFIQMKLNEAPTAKSLFNSIAVDLPVPEPALKRSRLQPDPAREKHRTLCVAEGTNLADFVLKQWPNSEPSAEGFESTVIDTELAMQRILPEWRRLHQNMELSEYIVRVQGILSLYKCANDTSVPQAWDVGPVSFRAPDRGSVIPSTSADLLIKSGPPHWDHRGHAHELALTKDLPQQARPSNERDEVSRATIPSREVNDLERILNTFATSRDVLRQHYGDDLKTSLVALKNVSNRTKHQEMPMINVNVTVERIEKAWVTLIDQFDRIQDALSANDDRAQWLKLGNLWPCTTVVAILEQLRSRNNHPFGNNMKEALVSYGILVTTLQQLLRIKEAQLTKKTSKLLDELANAGHENWDPLDFPDWLLLEIDSDILIRREQIDVAHAIISPGSGSNSVVQFNMGKGKTSCIVPMAVAILADEKQLSRLIIPKPLLLQTAQTLQSRLGGLVGREVRHVPFSRRTPTVPNVLRLYSELHREMHHCRGVILNAPEHVLSYKLSGLQHLVDSKLDAAREMVQFQSWLTATCRDVLDESDFTLAVKTQLIYPSGSQVTVDGHPHRWEVAQMLLSLVESHLPDLQHAFPRSIEVVKRSQGFPMVHFLQTDVEDDLHQRIVHDICSGRTSFLRFEESASPVSTGEIRSVLLDGNFNAELFERVARTLADKTSASKNLLLVRGLLLNRILLLCLKKRWNVQYGLHPDKYPIAVPFEAKGVPSEQAEFGHPDVAILFTCLAFYYSGLSYPQFCEGLRYILKSHDPPTEYDRWTSGSDTLPASLHHWNVINIDDHGQIEELWRHLRLSRNVLDHYMNNFVFPVHAKQFGLKLQASGWDLPLFSNSQPGGNGVSCVKTTGFSGTNDNRMMLPLTIRQDDLPSLRQTNAEVLTYLLQERNRKYIIAAWQGKRLTEEDLLRKITAMRIRILIDAGAYILEMSNESLVKTWLDLDTKAKAAVFFGADNRAWVQFRGGKNKVPLLATAFAENLDDCLVYLDEAHTRGVDLKLPQNARGALTLALGQTKDHTVQGKVNPPPPMIKGLSC
ncbi:hypothetical protein K504DRAFT_459665 [Pleomassaria siparia CBS 279.74]|uniref:ubiquitinyl hydrolase 1 n=1 Tax=Pleomassaria siparia CBS 279.74 TaxID=1314801 RepID=A0A6G1K1H2_9PLEO|nr:hypothetical protein K504DRAFT_459665 [Pleomassaria siparia CBS 279.74]